MTTKRFLLIAFLCSFMVNHLFASNVKLDSLKKEFLASTQQQKKIKILNELALYYMERYPEKGYRHSTQTLRLSQLLNLKGEKASALYNIGVYYYYKGDYNKAISFLDKALKIDEEIEYIKGIAAVNNVLGIIYLNLGRYKNSLSHFHTSLKISYELNDRNIAAYITNNIGMIFQKLNNYQKSLSYFKKTIQLLEEGLADDKYRYSRYLSNIGITYFYL